VFIGPFEVRMTRKGPSGTRQLPGYALAFSDLSQEARAVIARAARSAIKDYLGTFFEYNRSVMVAHCVHRPDTTIPLFTPCRECPLKDDNANSDS